MLLADHWAVSSRWAWSGSVVIVFQARAKKILSYSRVKIGITIFLGGNTIGDCVIIVLKTIQTFARFAELDPDPQDFPPDLLLQDFPLVGGVIVLSSSLGSQIRGIVFSSNDGRLVGSAIISSARTTIHHTLQSVSVWRSTIHCKV